MHLVGTPGYFIASGHTRKQLVWARAECVQQGGSVALAVAGQGAKNKEKKFALRRELRSTGKPASTPYRGAGWEGCSW